MEVLRFGLTSSAGGASAFAGLALAQPGGPLVIGVDGATGAGKNVELFVGTPSAQVVIRGIALTTSGDREQYVMQLAP